MSNDSGYDPVETVTVNGWEKIAITVGKLTGLFLANWFTRGVSATGSTADEALREAYRKGTEDYKPGDDD